MLKKSLEKVLFYESLLIFPAIIGALFIFDNLLKIIPGYYAKWNSALFSFYFFSLSALFVSLSTPFINLFNAIGKLKISLLFMVFWTVSLWILVLLFMRVLGYNGISISFFVLSLTCVFVIYTAKKLVNFSIIDSFKTSLVPSLVMGLYLVLMRILFLGYFGNVLWHIALSVVGASLIYFFMVYKLHGRNLFREIVELINLRSVK